VALGLTEITLPDSLPPGLPGEGWGLESNVSWAPVSSVPSGLRLTGYEILEELGRGGMGIVYRARHLGLNRLVALKMVRAGSLPAPGAWARFRVEAEALARLQHPNIVQIYEIGELDGCLFLSLELVDGPNLAEVLAGQPAPLRGAAELVRTLARAVHYAHQRGIIHRDLKPANVLLQIAECKLQIADLPETPARHSALCTLHSAIPKIADFGLAKRLGDCECRTQTGVALGTPSYMAPEQAIGWKDRIGPRTDVYALGAILYELITGQPPFEGETAWDTMMEVVNSDPVPPHVRRPEVPPALETICLKALAKEPGRRYASADDLADDLDRFLAGGAVAARPEGWARWWTRKLRRRPWAGALALAVLLLGLGAAILAVLGNRQKLAEAEAALAEGRELLRSREYNPALRRLKRGLDVAGGCWGGDALAQALDREILQTRRLLAAEELRRAADALRFLVDPETLSVRQVQTLDAQCRRLWEARHGILRAFRAGDPGLEQRTRTDLLDLVCLWADLKVRLPGRAAEQNGQQALQVLAEAEKLFGRSLALEHQRRLLTAAPGRVGDPASKEHKRRDQTPATAWDYYLVGRSWLRAGRPDLAAPLLEQAVALQPQGFWPNFYRGVCAQRLKRYAEADKALSICMALAPQLPQSYCNRALVHVAAGRVGQALRDYERALTVEPAFAPAALNRGLLLARLRRYREADADLRRALRNGADAATVHYNLAVLQFAQNNRPAALDAVNSALEQDPTNPKARQLLHLLERGRETPQSVRKKRGQDP
jgi:serine/threonine-protein kinase